VRMKNLLILMFLAWGIPAAAAADPLELAVISTVCGDLRYTVDASQLRQTDVDILRDIFSYMMDGLHVTYSYWSVDETLKPEGLPGANIHKGPSKERILKLIQEPIFAKRAGPKWVQLFQNYPANKKGSEIVQGLETNFSIQEFNGVVTDENCHTGMPF